MLLRDTTLPDGRVRDLRVTDDRIDVVGDDLVAEDDEVVVDASGLRAFPGAIDVHVHFREPGFTHKETWETGSRSAAAGGVTTVVDQPNTEPPTVTGESFDEKAARAADALVDYGLNGGVTGSWEPDALFDRDLFALGEVFLADSTGDMGIEEDLFETAVERAADADVPVTVHAEDATLFDDAAMDAAGTGTGRDADADAWSAYRRAEAEVAAIERAVEIGTDAGATIHVAHTSTPKGIDAAAQAGATCEVTPHHMFLSRDDLEELGTYGRMNPPLRSEDRRRAVLERVRDGTVDVVATDHAPHTRSEKEASIHDAPSGVPGVETMVPLLLAEAKTGLLSYQRVRDLTAANPARIFGIDRKGRIAEGMTADLVFVDIDRVESIDADRLHSKCNWTPFEGHNGVFPVATLVRGQPAYADPSYDVPDPLVPEDGEFGTVDGRNVRSIDGF